MHACMHDNYTHVHAGVILTMHAWMHDNYTHIHAGVILTMHACMIITLTFMQVLY